jgi:hypothetical protein
MVFQRLYEVWWNLPELYPLPAKNKAGALSQHRLCFI